ncbi:MAG TPA: crosslink repair DNA glycosylase YcaQ family protein, partial [Herpetosiphonaceae bacterium]
MALDLPAARALAIAAQRLDRRPDHPAAKADVLAAIRHLGVIQIDTIHVVARAPYFVLWSRLGEYDPRWFDELLYPDGLLFEYWAHAASFLPIELWPLFRHAMLNQAGERPRLATWRRNNAAVVAQVLDEIRRRGPLRSADFEAPPEHAGGGWWNWKPAKEALDISWLFGELMIRRRVNFQRVYELTERMLPQPYAAALDPAAARRQLADIALRALGLATERQLRDYYRMRADETAAALKLLLADGRAIE